MHCSAQENDLLSISRLSQKKEPGGLVWALAHRIKGCLSKQHTFCTFAGEQHVLPDTLLFYVDTAEVSTYLLSAYYRSSYLTYLDAAERRSAYETR